MSGLHYSSLLMAVASLPSKVENFWWSRNPRIQTFIETYITHLTLQVLLLDWTAADILFVSSCSYLVAAANVSNDPTVALTTISFTVCCIILLKEFVVGRLYKKWPMDALETFFSLNILFTTIFPGTASVMIRSHFLHFSHCCICAFRLIIIHHTYMYTMHSLPKGQKDKAWQKDWQTVRGNSAKPKPQTLSLHPSTWWWHSQV